MGVSVTLKYLKELGSGRYEYRRRVPESVKVTLGKGEFKRVFVAKNEGALSREHARVTTEYEALLGAAQRSGPAARRTMTPRAAALQALLDAEVMLSGISGAKDEDDRRELLADDLARRGADPQVYRAVVAPNAPLPKHTFDDARKLYLKEKLKGGEGADQREAKSRLERVAGRISGALGKRAAMPLVEFKRDDARKIRDYMLASDKKGGGKLSPASVKRELKMISAVFAYALKEFDLLDEARNPFEGLEVAGTVGIAAVVSDAEKRLPLPADIITGMQAKLQGDQALIWRILAGTGCRLAEVTGLRFGDVDVTSDTPFLRVTWHEGRGVKTMSSIRPVPLVGDALDTAKEALKVAEGETYLFPRYARERGPDAASAILMKHLRTLTKDKRNTVHSLRHNMKDRLRVAGVDKAGQDIVLGHASTSAGENYGGEEGRLAVAAEAMRKAFGLAEGT